MKAAIDDNRILRSPVSVKGASKEPAPEQAVPTAGEVNALADAVPEGYEATVILAAWCRSASAKWLPSGATAPARPGELSRPLRKPMLQGSCVPELVGAPLPRAG